MQYTVKAPSGFDLNRAGDRANQRLPLFENLEGLVLKLYLFDPNDRLYAPVYIWRDTEAAQNFLLGDLFDGVVETFGRPRVRSWQVLAYHNVTGSAPSGRVLREIDTIDDGTNLDTVAQRERARHDAQLGASGLLARVTALDPDRWEIARFSVWNSESVLPSCDTDCCNTYNLLAASFLSAA